ncbi:hypothetical protein NQ315_000699, partial [Exocentrus adspersus]
VGTERNRCKRRVKYIISLVQALEYSIIESQQSDRDLLTAVRLNSLRNNSIEIKMQDLEKENNQLLNTLHLNHNQHNISRTGSDSSCSTMSMVHLQYKYEELLANHNGLLKILELRMSDLRKYQEENLKLKEEIEMLKAETESYKEQILKLSEKNKELKYRKNNKIMRLKNDRNTLAIIHNRLVKLLHRQCMEKNALLHNEIRNTSNSEKALLLQEIRRNSMLSYENFHLQQENEYLQSMLNLKKHNCSEIMSV